MSTPGVAFSTNTATVNNAKSWMPRASNMVVALQELDGHGRGFAAADAQRRAAALQAALLQRAQQRDDDARARSADRMPQGAGTAMHVDDVVRQLELGHR